RQAGAKRRWARVTRRKMMAGLAALTCASVLVGGNANAWAFARAVPVTALRADAERATTAQGLYPHIGWIHADVRPGDVAITDYWEVRRELPTYGLRDVMPPWPSPGLRDQPQR